MSIHIEENLFSLETKNTLYQMMKDPYGQLLHLWYGKKTDQNMDYLINSNEINYTGVLYESQHDRSYSNDILPFELPVSGHGDFRISALSIELPEGSADLDLRIKEVIPKDHKEPLNGLPYSHDGKNEKAEAMDIVLEDHQAAIEVILHYSVFYETDVIARSVEVINHNEKAIRIRRIFPISLDFQEQKFDLIHFYGRHVMERQFEREPISHGIKNISSSRAMSSHQHNPALILASPNADELSGSCYGNLLMYSGSFAGLVEKDQIDQIRLLLGMNPDHFSWTLESNERFQSPEGLMSYSEDGFSTLSHNFHHVIEDHVMRGRFAKEAKPVLLNSWEAAYFTFDGLSILNLARETKELGADLLVLDDGWFGYRNNDYTSLGDWQVNEEKLQMPLEMLVRQVHHMGLKFGLWIEPEMISEDSDLYRKHPEWAMVIPSRKPLVARSQLVVDMANPEVVDYLYDLFSKIIRDTHLDYIKWDFNRSPDPLYSSVLPANRQSEVSHRFVLGTYNLLERLTQEFPDVLFEGCAGGGGRFDAGMLYYTPQIWCSDDTDAHERSKIQYGTSFFYPIRSVGSHVSAIPNHQTGRKISLNDRKIAASPGTFGYELNPAELEWSEKRDIEKQIIEYKRRQPLIFDGNYYRLSNPFEDHAAAWMFVDKNQDKALVQGMFYRFISNYPGRKVVLAGLDPDKKYEVTYSSFPLSSHGRFEEENESAPAKAIFSGQALMTGGIRVQTSMNDDAGFELELESLN